MTGSSIGVASVFAMVGLKLGLSTLVCVLQMSSSPGTVANAGKVVAAPHGGYDQQSELLARNIARRIDWGWVRATGYRSYPLRYWFDVNRPTERLWRSGRFLTGRETWEGRKHYDEYQSRLKRAARRTGAVTFLVEIHGHSRSVRAGSRNMRVEVIELATRGFTLAQLRRIKTKYNQLVRSVPAQYRVTLAIDRLDNYFEYRGWKIPFFFRASDAKRIGSLRSSQARKALHFELPRRVRTYSTARGYYESLFANLLEYAYSTSR